MVTLIIAGIAILGLYMAWTVGANDAANSMADAVGSKAIRLKWAIVAASICEFVGAVLVGSHVTDTVRKGIVSPSTLTDLPGLAGHEAAAIFVLGMAAALLAAALWLHLSTWLGMPVSTTHSIVGAVAGFGIVAAGWSSVNWGRMGGIVVSWIVSPIAGGVLAFVIFSIIRRLILGSDKPAKAAIAVMPYVIFFIGTVLALATIYKGLTHISEKMAWISGPRGLLLGVGIGIAGALAAKKLLVHRLEPYTLSPLSEQLERVERAFAPLVVFTSCTIAFAHGANDVANAIGPLAAVVDVLQSGTIKLKVCVPVWVLALGGTGIVLGLATFGYRVMHTVGTRITQLTPSRGVAADVAACTTVLVCTRLKLPISTTHTIVGAIIGVGLARGLAAVNRDVLKNIFLSWLVTVPAAALLTIILFVLGRCFLFESIVEVMRIRAGG